jgi:hypothetical protein
MRRNIGTAIEPLSLDQHVDRLFGEEVLHILSAEIAYWGLDPDIKGAIERALSHVFWSRFDAMDRRPIISDHDPLDRFQPKLPNNIAAVSSHHALRVKLDELRRRCFMRVVHPLIQELASGEILAFGRHEPLETADQAWVELPFGAMQDQRWRLCRGLSRVVILDEQGQEVSAFREVRLCAPQAGSNTVADPVLSKEPEPRRDQDKIPYSDLALRQWLQLRATTFPKDEAPPSGVACLAAARKKFDRVSRDVFRLVRRNSVPKTWQKKGQRRPLKK